MNSVKENIHKENINLILLKSDTENIIETITDSFKKKKKYNFWELLSNN